MATYRSTLTFGRLAALTAAILLAVTLFVASPARSADASPTSDSAWQLLTLTNNDRAANGLGALQMSSAAVDVAQGWANHLAATGSLVHNPNYVAQLAAAVGGQWTQVGENIGYGQSVQQLEPMFMNSPHHRANILGPYNYVGIATAFDGNGTLWVVVDFVASPVPQPTLRVLPTMPQSQAVPFVTSAYNTFFGRNPNNQELSYWSYQLMTGNAAPSQLLNALATSAAWVGRLVTNFYVTTLGRAPDANGFNYWVSKIQQGFSPAMVASLFYGSPEYIVREGDSLDGWLTALYEALVNRAPDANGLAAWKAQFFSGDSAGSIAYSFYQSNESLADRINALYEQMLGRSVDPSGLQYWTAQLRDSGNDVLLAVHLADSSEYVHRAMARYPA